MAIRERKGCRSRPWECYWNNPYTNKREYAFFETRQEAEKHDSLIKHRLKFERESFCPKEEEKETNIMLEQAFVLYLREKQFTKRLLANQLSIMRPVLKLFGRRQLIELTREDLAAAINDMLIKGIKPATIRTIFGRLFTLLRWSAEKGFCPLPQLPRLPAPNYELFIPPTHEELVSIMEVAPPHLQRVIIFGAQLGARIGPSELFRLTWRDVDLVQGIIRIHGAKKNLRAPWREVPIRDNLIPVLAQWALEDKRQGILHIIHYGGKPVQSIKTTWSNTLRKAGITRRIRPYDLRHAFATELLAAGADIGTVAKLMGHSDATMVLTHYQYVMDKQKRKAIENMPEFEYVKIPCEKSKGGYEKNP